MQNLTTPRPRKKAPPLRDLQQALTDARAGAMRAFHRATDRNLTLVEIAYAMRKTGTGAELLAIAVNNDDALTMMLHELTCVPTGTVTARRGVEDMATARRKALAQLVSARKELRGLLIELRHDTPPSPDRWLWMADIVDGCIAGLTALHGGNPDPAELDAAVTATTTTTTHERAA